MDDFDQDIIIDNASSERQENTVVIGGTNDRDFTFGSSSNNLVTNENTVRVETSERCFNGRIDSEMTNIVDTDEDRIQKATSTAFDTLLLLKMN